MSMVPGWLVMVLAVSVMCCIPAHVQAETTTLTASRDTTIFSESADLSLGADDRIFAGRAGNNGDRRALLKFDLAGIPRGASIHSATLELTAVRMPSSTAFDFSLHRLENDWGEEFSFADRGVGGGGAGGTAMPGDATWSERFYESLPWSSPGGDFNLLPTVAFRIGPTGRYTIIGENLLDDLQSWADDPSTNFGWIILGSLSTRSVKGFASREATEEGDRPTLVVEWTAPEAEADTILEIDIVASTDSALVRLSFPTDAGFSYQVIESRDLMDWKSSGPPLTGTGQEMEVFRVVVEKRFFKLIKESATGSGSGGGG